jgi:hypothetical protein
MLSSAPTVDPNPYAPPLADPAVRWPVLPAERWGELHLAASLVSQRTMERVVRITGSLVGGMVDDLQGRRIESECFRRNRCKSAGCNNLGRPANLKAG